MPLGQRNIAVLFGQHRNLRRQRQQTIGNYPVRGQVGGGNRRIVGLVGYRDIGAPEWQDRLACRQRQLDHFVHQLQVVHSSSSPR
ncbi:hypothetical protein D9M73_191050 [compost metagenome]